MTQTAQTRHIVIIGAGPAGLTAAHELLRAKAGFRVTLVEADTQVGGISKTVNYKGNRIDLGGHRFFSKSDWVMDWWRARLPVANATASEPTTIAYRNQARPLAPESRPITDPDAVLLLRRRLSRIYFAGQLFAYPLQPSLRTAWQLGPWRVLRMLVSYLQARLHPIHPETSLEDFFINRFGRVLYRTFFKDYTEKVWGVTCAEMPTAWGAQRVKSLSIGRALLQVFTTPLRRLGLCAADQPAATSLIEQFLYPKYGPGQMWETVAAEVTALGGELRLHQRVTALSLTDQGTVRAVELQPTTGGAGETLTADAVISTMPVAELIAAMQPSPPAEVRRIAAALPYRDFLTVGLLLKRLQARTGRALKDNWIYIQEPGVKVGRLQVFNNWSPAMVADPNTLWVGMEYFCQAEDALWRESDDALIRLALDELIQLGLARAEDWLDGVVLRVPKAYPGYHGAYAEFDQIRAFTDAIPNLFLVGRNGMHRYNNQDHSMLTARLAAEAIIEGRTDKEALWAVNIGDDYHEEK